LEEVWDMIFRRVCFGVVVCHSFLLSKYTLN
jgi:hypothetical protein